MTYIQSITELTPDLIEGYIRLRWELTPPQRDITSSKLLVNASTSVNRAQQNRSLIRIDGVYYQFYRDVTPTYVYSFWYKYSLDLGETWSAPINIATDYVYDWFSVKYEQGYIYMVHGGGVNSTVISFYKGTALNGIITWTTNAFPITVSYMGTTVLEVGALSTGIPVIYYATGGDIRIYLRVATNTAGTAWGAATLIELDIGSDYNSAGLVRLANGTMMAVVNYGNGVSARYYDGSTWLDAGLDLYPYYYHNVGYSAIEGGQTVSDNCSNVYFFWQWKDDFIVTNPLHLYLQWYNVQRGTWTSTLIATGFTGPVYPCIARGTRGMLHLYYTNNGKIYRVNVIDNVPGSPVEIYDEGLPITKLQCTSTSYSENDGTSTRGLSYICNGTIKFLLDVYKFPMEEVVAIDLYRRYETEEFYTEIAELAPEVREYIDENVLDTGTYYYALRTRTASGATTDTVYTDIIQMPGSYIEFAGRGGYNALRHVIDSHFSSTEDDHNVMLFRLWNTSNTDANETPLDNAVYMKLRGNRKIETVNTQPYTTDSYVLGEGELSWAEIFSIISKSDKNTSARLKLWNGR